MNKIKILRFVIIMEMIIIPIFVNTISRDYQDSWILEGLEIPYALFCITYIGYFLIEKRFNWLILFALVSHITFLLIPNFKYVWFQGVAIDQHRQYQLAMTAYDKGYVAEGMGYSETPLLAISFTILSYITSISILQSVKYFPLMLWFTYPLWIYIIMKKLDINSSVVKYALLISSIPIKSITTYMVSGSLFGVFFVFLILIQFIYLLKNKDRRYWFISSFFIFDLVYGHTVSSIYFSTLIIIVFILSVILGNFSRDFGLIKTKFSIVSAMMVIVVSITWLLNVAKDIFEGAINTISMYISRLLNFSIVGRLKGFIPMRFFEISLIDRLKILLVFDGADLFLILLSAISLIIIIRDILLKKKIGLIFLYLYIISIGLFFLLGLILNLGFNWYDRMFRYFLIISPIFLGIILQRIEIKLHGKVLPILIIGMLACMATVELYRCQPLIPSASSLRGELESDIPIVYVNEVNAVYQRYLIYYAENHIKNSTIIAADKVTGNQLYGLTDSNFLIQQKIIYPLIHRYKSKEPTYYLLHYPGISGKFSEQAENRTKSLISSIIYDSKYNVIYSNAESYILNSFR